MTNRTYDLVSFGAAAVDDIVQLEGFPERDTKVRITRLERRGGGQCAAALVAAARQGLRCAYGGVLGCNELSEYTRGWLKANTVEVVGGVRYPEARPYYSIVLVDRSAGERTLLYSDQDVHSPGPGDICEETVFRSRMLLVDQLGPAGTLHACRLARRAGTQILADFEWVDDERQRQAVAMADHLIIPWRLARKMTGCNDPAEAVRALAGPGRFCAAATDGARGCWFVEGDGAAAHQPGFRVKVVDSTGCGDVFHGAYAAAFLGGMPTAAAIRYAAGAAALKAASGTEQGFPDRAAVLRFLESARETAG